MAGNLLELTNETFDEEVGSSELPLIVDFWAEWCGPCRMVAPILEQIAVEHAGAIKVAKLNVDDNPEMSRKYGVMSIPTLILFKEGEEKARVIGAKPKDAILREIEPHVAA